MDMRAVFVWTLLLIALGVFIAMLVSVWRHRPAVGEYVWTLVPWIIVAICAAPAVHQVLAAGSPMRSVPERVARASPEHYMARADIDVHGMEKANVAPGPSLVVADNCP